VAPQGEATITLIVG